MRRSLNHDDAIPTSAIRGLLAYWRLELPEDKFEALLDTCPMFPDEIGLQREPIPFKAYNSKATWWRPGELHEPRFGERQGVRSRWKTSSLLATSLKGDQRVVYVIYLEEP